MYAKYFVSSKAGPIPDHAPLIPLLFDSALLKMGPFAPAVPSAWKGLLSDPPVAASLYFQILARMSFHRKDLP